MPTLIIDPHVSQRISHYLKNGPGGPGATDPTGNKQLYTDSRVHASTQVSFYTDEARDLIMLISSGLCHNRFEYRVCW